MDALLCKIDENVVAIPIVGLIQIVEVEATPPPPGAMPWIGGLAVFQGSVVVIVTLGKPAAAGAPLPNNRRVAHGLLFGGSGAGAAPWMVEVGRALSVADVRAVPHTIHAVDWETACRSEWFLDGVTGERQVLPFVDVGRIAAALASAA